jgi:hypothetical protein
LNRIKELTEQFYEKKYTCLIADPEKIIFTSFDKGVKPLFDFYNTMKNDTNSEKELYLIDKVIGKGAAYLCILSGIKRIRTVSRREHRRLQRPLLRLKPLKSLRKRFFWFFSFRFTCQQQAIKSPPAHSQQQSAQYSAVHMEQISKSSFFLYPRLVEL